MRRLLKKLKMELLYDLAIPLMSIYPKELKSGSRRDICTSMSIVAFFTIAKTHTHTHTVEYYSTLKNKEILSFAIIWMNL